MIKHPKSVCLNILDCVLKGAVAVFSVFLLSACSWIGFQEEEAEQDKRPTLADITQYTEPSLLARSSVEAPNLDQLIADYKALLALSLDEKTKREIAYRLADLQMLASEENQLAEEEVIDTPFDQTIAGYQNLLSQFPENPANEHLLYQLAKAYNLSAQTTDSILTIETLLADFPNTQYRAEVQFRRGEFYYARKKYQIANTAYQDVIGQGDETNYYLNALFMRGWTRFKLSDHRGAHLSFIQLLDWHQEKFETLQSLQKSQQSLVNDSLRLMSLMFSYSESNQPIKSLLKQVGPRDYEPMLYQHFGNLLVSQERFADASNQLRLFITDHPQHAWNFEAHQQLIKILIKAKLPKKVLQEKREFVELYGVKTEYWNALQQKSKMALQPILASFLNELSAYFHGLAQQYEKRKKTLSLTKKDYLIAAAGYYRAYIDTVPKSEGIAEKYYYLAEVEFDLKRYLAAIDSYEVAGYQHPSFQQRVEAAYASVVAREQYWLLIQSPEHSHFNQKEIIFKQKIEAQLRFAKTYPQSDFAIALHQKSIEEVFNRKEYQLSLDYLAQFRTQFNPQRISTKSQLQLTEVEAHSLFFLEQYQQAELVYTQLLNTKNYNISKTSDIKERLAASIYKQGESLVNQQQWQLAIDTFLRVAQVVPSASIRATADFDAGHYAFQQKLWIQAINILTQFRQQFPKHELINNIPAKLAIAFENSQQPLKAANEYLQISAQSQEPEMKRQALYQAASIFETQNDIDNAIKYFRNYAHAYPAPFETLIEVQYKMSQFYVTTNDHPKRRFWLKKLIDSDAKSGEKRSARSRYLAAFASTIFAEDARIAFNRIKLTLPLKKSLGRKKKAMQKAIKGLERVNSYQIADFATEATFKIGQIYTQLSADILDSDRPKLDEMAMEQYEIILEEQAYPFEEYAINIHEANAQRSWQGIYDDWVKKSFTTLESLMPARYKKTEQTTEALSYE
jgi:cellulose synthase operon protein C